MAWVVLILSGMFEAVWAIALDRSEGFSKLGPSLVFLGALIVSMGGLAYAMRELPVGSSYAVWVGIGAVIAVIYSFTAGLEPVSLGKILFVAMIVGGVIGLQVLSD